MTRSFWLAAIAFAVAGGSASAQGIQSSCPYYFPIRATGAACHSGNAIAITGTNACCVAAPRGSSTIRVPNMPSGADRYQAGLALGIVGVGIIVELINLFGPSVASASAPNAELDYERRVGRVAGERAEAVREAQRWHAAAMREVQKGDMRSAEGFLAKAAKLAEDGADYELRNRYQIQLDTVLATRHMMEGLALQAEGRRGEALREMLAAGSHARLAGQVKLAERIDGYRRQLRSGTPESGAPGKKETGICMMVNGARVCE
jgi:hypothetical protein